LADKFVAASGTNNVTPPTWLSNASTDWVGITGAFN
jgi:hypothetical protein